MVRAAQLTPPVEVFDGSRHNRTGDTILAHTEKIENRGDEKYAGQIKRL